MGYWSRNLLPRLIDLGMRGEDISRERALALEGVRGRVVELGFGSGLNIAHYPEGVEEVLAVEPNLVAQKLAAPRIAAARFPVRFVGLDGQSVPLADASADAVVCTWSLCTIPDPMLALSEARRILAPGGRFFFVEHGLSEDERVARWQRRLNPLQSLVFGGCRLDRPIDELIRSAGFEITDLERYYAKGPRPLAAFYRGSARR